MSRCCSGRGKEREGGGKDKEGNKEAREGQKRKERGKYMKVHLNTDEEVEKEGKVSPHSSGIQCLDFCALPKICQRTSLHSPNLPASNRHFPFVQGLCIK